MIRALAACGFKLFATEGTGRLVLSLGVDNVTVVGKLTQERPNMVDIILEGLVNAVVNTVSGGRESMKDSFQIRRAAVERRIPCFTSLDRARAGVEALVNGATRFNVLPYRGHLRSSLAPTGAGVKADAVPDAALPSAKEEAR